MAKLIGSVPFGETDGVDDLEIILKSDWYYQRHGNPDSGLETPGVTIKLDMKGVLGHIPAQISVILQLLPDANSVSVPKQRQVSQSENFNPLQINDNAVARSRPRAEEAINLARSWLESCTRHHSRCETRDTDSLRTWRPTRLINILPQLNGDPQVKLQEASLNEYLPTVRYIALSHRWLTNDQTRLYCTNHAKFRHDIPLGSLKQAIRDAIELCEGLGVFYLWIDSLCIIQDSAADCEREISLMDQIYGSAYCTIAAANADTLAKGCFDTYDRTASRNYAIHFDIGNGSRKRFRMRLTWQTGCEDLDQSVLASRGWIFQERFLSARTIHFSAEQMHWECRQTEASETYPTSTPFGYSFRSKDSQASIRELLSEKAMENHLKEILRSCNCGLTLSSNIPHRDMTFIEDRLRGIAGISNYCHQVLYFGTYLHGIWMESLPQALLWNPTGNIGERKSLPQVGPSWSWAGLSGPVEYLTNLFDPDHRIFAKSPKSNVKMGSRVGFGIPWPSRNEREKPQTNSGKRKPLCLRSQPWQAVVKVNLNNGGSVLETDELAKADHPILNTETYLDVERPLPVKVTCLPIVEHAQDCFAENKYELSLFGLLLVSERLGSGKVYRRIGWFIHKMESSKALRNQIFVAEKRIKLPFREKELQLI